MENPRPLENLEINGTKSSDGMTLQTRFEFIDKNGAIVKVNAYQGILANDIKTEIQVNT